MIFLTTLNGCVQGVAFLGPAFSYSQSGNIMQSALSYGSNQAFQKIKNKSITENKKSSLDNEIIPNNDYPFLLIQR